MVYQKEGQRNSCGQIKSWQLQTVVPIQPPTTHPDAGVIPFEGWEQ